MMIADLERERSMLEEMKAIDAYISWQANPCGKPELKLIELDILPAPLEERAGVEVLGCDVCTADRFARSVALQQVQSAFWYSRTFPEPFAFYAGWQGGRWMLEIYGKGEPYPLLREPPKPDLMK